LLQIELAQLRLKVGLPTGGLWLWPTHRPNCRWFRSSRRSQTASEPSGVQLL